MSGSEWSAGRVQAIDLEDAGWFLWGMCIGHSHTTGQDIRLGSRREGGELVELWLLDFGRKVASTSITRATDTVQITQAWKARMGRREVWRPSPMFFDGHPDAAEADDGEG